MPGDLCTAPRIISLSPLSLATDVTLGASGLLLGTQTGAGGTATLTKSFFFGRSPWLHGNRTHFWLLSCRTPRPKPSSSSLLDLQLQLVSLSLLTPKFIITLYHYKTALLVILCLQPVIIPHGILKKVQRYCAALNYSTHAYLSWSIVMDVLVSD